MGVEEVDEAVAEFPLFIPRRSNYFIGEKGSTIRRISADSNVRIYVPPLGANKDKYIYAMGQGAKYSPPGIQLEGIVENIFSALRMMLDAIHSGNNKDKSNIDSEKVSEKKSKKVDNKNSDKT